MPEPVVLRVTEASQVGEARRSAAALTARLGFSATNAGKAALVVTEVANNLVRHARDGLLALRPLLEEGVAGLEVMAIDAGPGMADLPRCMADGYSTGGSPGTGLGAIARLSSFLDVYSTPSAGTVLVCRLWSGPPPAGRRLGVGAVSVPVAGESVCGDAWGVEHGGGRSVVMVADGLGHGPLAADASRVALRALADNAGRPPLEILQAAHAALSSTRGAAVAVAEVDLDAQAVRFAGVGNVAACILSGGASRSLVSHNGTLGHEARRFQSFDYPFPKGSTLVLHSDGVTSRWNLGDCPGLAMRDPAVLAGVLFRDFRRPRDDATVLAAAEAGGGPP